MLQVPEHIRGFSHPLIESVFLKKDSSDNSKNKQNILLVDTIQFDADDDHEMFDSYLIELMDGLKELQAHVEKMGARCDRIDVRSH